MMCRDNEIDAYRQRQEIHAYRHVYLRAHAHLFTLPVHVHTNMSDSVSDIHMQRRQDVCCGFQQQQNMCHRHGWVMPYIHTYTHARMYMAYFVLRWLSDAINTHIQTYTHTRIHVCFDVHQWNYTYIHVYISHMCYYYGWLKSYIHIYIHTHTRICISHIFIMMAGIVDFITPQSKSARYQLILCYEYV